MAKKNDSRVELRPHGDFDQFYVLIDGRQIGYVGKAECSPINLIVTVSESQAVEFKKLVDEAKGCVSKSIASPVGLFDLPSMANQQVETGEVYDA